MTAHHAVRVHGGYRTIIATGTQEHCYAVVGREAVHDAYRPGVRWVVEIVAVEAAAGEGVAG